MWCIVHVWDEKEDNLLSGAEEPPLRCGTATEEETTETRQCCQQVVVLVVCDWRLTKTLNSLRGRNCSNNNNYTPIWRAIARGTIDFFV